MISIAVGISSNCFRSDSRKIRIIGFLLVLKANFSSDKYLYLLYANNAVLEIEITREFEIADPDGLVVIDFHRILFTMSFNSTPTSLWALEM